MNSVKPKKFLGQHFLTDLSVASRIADTVDACPTIPVLEVGPGTGVLTQYLLRKERPLKVVEIDFDSVPYLHEHFPELGDNIIEGDFLKMNLQEVFDGHPFVLTGNYPYNISSQIFFKMVENRDLIPCCTGMIQKEVAERLAAAPGGKTYGVLSVLMQAKRSENMSFKSTNDATKAMGISSSINHLPAFTQDHTYALAALYPYATQLADGEWAYQTELGYLFKKNTPLGGRYGMNVKLNFSYIRAIQRDFLHSVSHPSLSGTKELAGTDGYRSSFFKWGGDTYYQDFSIQLSRRLSRPFRLSLMYLNQHYNQTIVEGHGGMIRSNIFIADGKYQFSSKTTLRGELQYLTTAEDEGDWLFGLLELSLVPHWMVTISDMYNAGSSHLHYYQAFITSNWNAHRIQIGYGRTRAGYNCSGGVCRYIPAYKGLTLSYNYNF